VSDVLGARLSRWSQRKAAARRGGAPTAEAEAVLPPTGHVEDANDAGRERQNAASAATQTDGHPALASGEDVPVLPPVEELTFQSDFTVFMANNVPDAIKRAALRKLWVSDPVLANLDGLNDYCEDLNIVDTPITLAQTSYRVGNGYFDEIGDKLATLDEASAGAGGEPAESQADSAVPARNGAPNPKGSAGEDTDIALQQSATGMNGDAPVQSEEQEG
jgi:Protein of unknown function (DUF3306)